MATGADAPPKASVKIPKDDHGQVQGRADSMASDLHAHYRSVDDKGNYQMARGRMDRRQGFPAQYFPDDEQADTRIAIKKKLLATPARPLGDAMLTDEDIKWYMGKENIRKRILFDAWYSKLFDTTDINKLRLAQQIYPDYFKIREEEIDRQAAIQKKLALIKLRGVRDLDDLQFIYALQNGEVHLRNSPLYELDRPMVVDGRTFRRGLWNPSKWVRGDEADRVPAFMGLGVWDTPGQWVGANVPDAAGFMQGQGFDGPSTETPPP